VDDIELSYEGYEEEPVEVVGADALEHVRGEGMPEYYRDPITGDLMRGRPPQGAQL
jgi:hypothetical protein